MKILAFGEILWDVYEDKSIIGGAPLNFSAHLSKLGAAAYAISAVGNDSLGEKTLSTVKDLGVKTDYVFTDTGYPTGTCTVTCSNEGQPSYKLAENTAFDNIVLKEADIDKIKAHDFDAFYFGTLSQRNATSNAALGEILAKCSFSEVFCDLNIRPNCYTAQSIENCLKHSTILKISREEHPVLLQYGFSSLRKAEQQDPLDFYKALCADLARNYTINIIIITLDKDGAIVYTRQDDRLYVSEKPKNKAVSTVGAGDSFSACFLYNYLKGTGLTDCISRAVTLSDYVVAHYAAVPDYSQELCTALSIE